MALRSSYTQLSCTPPPPQQYKRAHVAPAPYVRDQSHHGAVRRNEWRNLVTGWTPGKGLNSRSRKTVLVPLAVGRQRFSGSVVVRATKPQTSFSHLATCNEGRGIQGSQAKTWKRDIDIGYKPNQQGTRPTGVPRILLVGGFHMGQGGGGKLKIEEHKGGGGSNGGA